MDLSQRWALMLTINLLNVGLYNLENWQFWVIALAAGYVCSPLSKK